MIQGRLWVKQMTNERDAIAESKESSTCLFINDASGWTALSPKNNLLHTITSIVQTYAYQKRHQHTINTPHERKMRSEYI